MPYSEPSVNKYQGPRSRTRRIVDVKPERPSAFASAIVPITVVFCAALVAVIWYAENHVSSMFAEPVDTSIQSYADGDYTACSKLVELAGGGYTRVIWYEVGEGCHSIKGLP